MHLTGDQICSEGLSLNKNYLDNYRGLSGQLNQMMMTPTTQINYQTTHHQQQQQENENIVAAENAKHQQQQSNQQQNQNSLNGEQRGATLMSQQTSMSKVHHNVFQNLQQQQQQQQQPGENLLSFNEMQLCNALNLPPTYYISLKTVMLSGSPLSTNSRVENIVRKFFIRAGWLSQ